MHQQKLTGDFYTEKVHGNHDIKPDMNITGKRN